MHLGIYPSCIQEKKKNKVIKDFHITESYQFSSVQSLSRVWLFVTPRIAAHQASLSITNSQSLPKHMSMSRLNC